MSGRALSGSLGRVPRIGVWLDLPGLLQCLQVEPRDLLQVRDDHAQETARLEDSKALPQERRPQLRGQVLQDMRVINHVVLSVVRRNPLP